MAKGFFKSENGLIQYCVLPYDHFILDTLEKLNYDEFIYRILKEEGFDRVVFCENAGNKCEFTAFDKLSHLSFTNYKDFENVDLKNGSELQSFYEKISQKDSKNEKALAGIKRNNNPGKKEEVKEKGKRVIKDLDTQAEFLNDFGQNITAYLKSVNNKSAMVIELAALKRLFDIERNKAIGTGTRLYSFVEYLQKHNENKNNVLVITVKERDELYALFTDSSLSGMHDFVNRISNGSYREGCVDKAVEELKRIGCILLAESIGYDEIANVIFRKKFIEKNEAFEAIPVSKVYALSALIKKQLLNQQKVFENLRFNACGGGDYIDTLEAVLRDPAFVEELIEHCVRVQYEQAKRVNKRAVDVERVTGSFIRYTENRDYDNIMSRFDNLIGMAYLKAELDGIITDIEARIKEYEEKQAKGEASDLPFMNFVLLGKPGTGKTTVAKILAEALSARGVVANPEAAFLEANKFSSDGTVGKVESTLTRELDKYKGCVVFIDEAYNFCRAYSGGNTGDEAWSAIMGAVNSGREAPETRRIIILAGYEDETKEFMSLNPGSDRRFPYEIKIDDYTTDQLIDIFKLMVGKTDITSVIQPVKKVIDARRNEKGRDFGNAGEVENIVSKLRAARRRRTDAGNDFVLEDILTAYPQYKAILTENKESYDEIVKCFDKYIEIDDIKDKLLTNVKFIKNKKNIYDNASDKTKVEFPRMGMRFVGPPGTGKTDIAEIAAKFYCEAGILSNPKPIVIKATEISGGGTLDILGEKLKALFDKNNGSVIVLDEVYDFYKPYSGGGNAGNEAVSAIMYAADKYRESMLIIICGYKKDTDRLIGLNSGMLSRFPEEIQFHSYSTDVLLEIFKKVTVDYNTEAILPMVRRVIEFRRKADGDNFGNARFIKDELIPNIEKQYCKRDGDDYTFMEEDIKKAYPEVFTADKVKTADEKVDALKLMSLAPAYEKCDYSGDEAGLEGNIKNSVLFVKTDKGYGTAFLVSPEGYAITCNHVVEGATDITARLRIEGRFGGDDSEHKCTVLKTDKAMDIALIKLEGSNFPYLNLAPSSRKVEVFEKYILSGYPFGSRTQGSMTSFKGSIATADDNQRDENGLIRYMLNGEGKSGNSGSPIISLKDGCVIGLLLGSITSGSSGGLVEEINYMRPISYFWEHFTK